MLCLEIKLDLGETTFSRRSGGCALFSYSVAMQTNHRRFSQHLHAGGTLIKLYQVPLPLHLKLLNSCQMASVQCAISAWKDIFHCRFMLQQTLLRSDHTSCITSCQESVRYFVCLSTVLNLLIFDRMRNKLLRVLSTSFQRMQRQDFALVF